MSRIFVIVTLAVWLVGCSKPKPGVTKTISTAKRECVTNPDKSVSCTLTCPDPNGCYEEGGPVMVGGPLKITGASEFFCPNPNLPVLKIRRKDTKNAPVWLECNGKAIAARDFEAYERGADGIDTLVLRPCREPLPSLGTQ